MQKVIYTMSNMISMWKKEELGSSNPHSELLQNAIADFQTFSKDYEDYFETLIDNNKFDPTKTTAERMRYQYAQTLQHYWSSLEQVILQWQLEYYRDTLGEAHEQANKYLKQLNLPSSGILIYFNKVANIRYLPFTQIPILGIPYPFSDPERWSAIPHEIGHYVYWNMGRNLHETQRRQKKLKSDAMNCLKDAGIDERQSKLVMQWLEEIFSDVVGTRVDGGGFVTSSDHFLRTQAGNEHDLLLNDGHHPPLVLRPFVWYRALKKAIQPKLDEIFEMVNLTNLNNFKIQSSSPIISERDNVAVPRTDFSEQDFESFNFNDLLPSMENLVDFLGNQLDEILPTIHIGLRKQSAFQELQAVISQEKQTETKFEDKEVYEILLMPRALEEGYSHYHGIQTFHGWHEATSHSH